MGEAAKEDKVAATERRRGENGTPRRAAGNWVVVDKMWSNSKRSALSGAAIIIGHHSRKVL